MIDSKIRFKEKEKQLIFINAWNEWAEGAHLEPDERYGYAWLEAVRTAHIQTKNILSAKIAIVIHAFYEDVLAEIVIKLKSINSSNINIYVTTHHGLYYNISKIFEDNNIKCHISAYNNRGRDVLPFIKISKKVLEDKNDFIIKIHTKKSLHRRDGDKWREEIYTDLLSDRFIKSAITTLHCNKDIGIVAPTNQIVPMNYYWGSNEATVMRLASKLGLEFKDIEHLNFVAGTMFIIKPHIVYKLLELDIQDKDFEAENNQVDGTMAHAIERFISIICHQQGQRIVTLGEHNVNTQFQYANIG